MRKQKKVLTQFITGLVILAQVLASFSAAATAVIQPSALAPLLGQPSVAQAAAAKPDVAASRSNPIEAAVAAPVAAPLAAGGPASLSGLVYNDYNANGTRDTAAGNAIDNGMGGVTVTAYDASGAMVATATSFAVICLGNNNPAGQGCTAASTPALGAYTLSNLPASTSVRVEFTTLPTAYFSAPQGANNATSVRFVTTTAGATANLDFGILKPGDYCQNNPMLCVPEMIAGDPANATTGAVSALKKWNYAAANGNVTPVNLANDSLVGTVWGLAYARQTDKLYSAAFLKRHAGLGPNGLGAIYVTNNPRTGTGVSTALFFDVATIVGVNVGTVPSNSARGLTTPAGTALDTAIYDKVGKVGLGDIDISDDESMLWTISLNDKKLIGIPVNNPSAATAQVYTIPDPGCTAGSGDYRPFATKYYRGQLYLGVTCDASLSLQRNDLKAVVYRFDPANPGAGFVNILTAPLNYTKGAANSVCSNVTTRWYPWVNSPYPAGFDPKCPTAGNKALAQPLLSDLEFDLDGSLILGFIDRFAHQAGSGLALPDGTSAGETMGGGDILRAWNNNGSFVLENNGAAGPVSGGVGNNQGPGGGEFYRGEFISAFPGVAETALGGLAFLPGSGEVVTPVWDPFTANSRHGVAFLSNTNGNATRRHDLGTNLRFSKGAGLGDLEVLCDLAPIELGNRVWKDTNGNGIQDPGELGILGVVVNLTTITGTVVVAATTDVNGNYYFSSATGATTGSAKYGLTIRPNTAYEIRIANATGASQQTALAGMTLTTANAQANTNDPITDVRDSDAAMNSTAAVISYTTGVAGANNHGLDFGFYSFGTVQIVKQTVGGDGTFTLSSADSTFNNLSLTTSAGIGSSAVFTKPIGSYVITENSQAGWNLIGFWCSGDTNNNSISNLASGQATLNLDAGENLVCTFANSATPSPTTGSDVLTVTKTVDWNGNTPNPGKIFNINITGPSYPSGHADTITAGASKVYPNLVGGTYTVTEISPGAGWVITYSVPSGAVPLGQPIAPTTAGLISGNVFRDFNADGVDAGATEPGVAGVSVIAYDPSGVAVGTAATAATGAYSFTPIKPGPYRIEFTNLPAGDEPTMHGTGNGTSTQFVTTNGAAPNINLGVSAPCDYCQDNPRLVVPIMRAGNNVGSATVGLASQLYNSATGVAAERVDATLGQIGSTWGEGYQREQKRIYVGAMLKRHIGFGPQGPGGVYALDYTNPAAATLANSFTLQGITPANGGATIDLGTVNRTNIAGTIAAGAAGDYQLPTIGTNPSRDIDAFAKVGKTAYGDIDVDDTGNNLWLVNLNQRALIKMDVSGSLAALPATTSQYSILGQAGVPTCPGGELRPWGLKFYLGKGYLGTVCDASLSQNRNDLHAYVLAFDPANVGAGFSVAMSVPLTQTREAVQNNALSPGFRTAQSDGSWKPWADTWAQTGLTTTDDDRLSYAQPILSDIEFLPGGDMVLGFANRFAEQSGMDNDYPISGITRRYGINNAGDMVKACNVGGTYVLESYPGCPEGDTGTGNQQGADGYSNSGEFFWGEKFIVGGIIHNEIANGSLAVLPGSNEIVSSAFDPAVVGLGGGAGATGAFGQGLIFLNTTTGDRNDGWQIDQAQPVQSYDPSRFGKGNAMGDVEVLCDLAPLEIGNRVWKDLNGNGVQDPGEPGVNGITISRQGPTSTVTTVTSGDGNYYFSNLKANTAYTLTINPAQAALSGLSLTQANAQAISGSTTSNNAILDTRDSDAVTRVGNATIYYTTGSAGQNNHGLDFGWTASASSGAVTIGNTAPQIGAIIIRKATVPAGSNQTFNFTSNVSNYTSFTLSDGGSYTMREIPVGSYTVTETVLAGWTQASSNCTNSSTLGTIQVSHSLTTTCTILNALQPTSTNTLTVTKTVNWNSNPPAPGKLFDINITGPAYLSGHPDTISDGQTKVYSNLTAGVYTVTETSPGSGWIMTYTVGAVNSSSRGVVNLNAQPIVPTTAGPISGNVFRDYNADGVDAGATEPGVAGVTVTAYDPYGIVVGTATTTATGAYSFTPNKPGPYRVEFTNVLAGDEPTMHGTGNGTSTQFVTASGAATNINLGVNVPADYCQNNPKVCTTVFANGLPSAGGYPSSIVSFDYNFTGQAPQETPVVNKSVTGAVWGLAYARNTKALYSSAFVKRHSGLYENPVGTPHPGMIFVSDLAGGTTVPFIDLANYGASVGAVPSNSVRGLGASGASSADATVFDQVGKVGLGDVDISTDETTLWAVSLNDKKLFKIKIDADNNPGTPPVLGDVTSYPIPDPVCTGGAWRPFALKYANNTVYVGGVCDAQTSQLKADLHAYVYKFDISLGTFTIVLSNPLNYAKQGALITSFGCPAITGWYGWASTFAQVTTPLCYAGPPAGVIHPQPMLTDLEFDTDGSLILGFADRTGHQGGRFNINTSGTGNYEFMTGGDILRACTNGSGGYTLESGGKCNAVGPGGAEYYSGDSFSFSGVGVLHAETSHGGLALKPGSGEVVVSAMDPVDGNGNQQAAGGVIYLNNTAGVKNRSYAVYANNDNPGGILGKSGGMGDVELLCDAAPLEIGNRVWKDLNGNGVQDPGEPGVNGITISRQGPTSTVTTVTSGDGNYYFSNLKANTAYTLTINPAQVALSGLRLTQANAQAINGSPSSNDIILDTRDSDAVTIGGNATIYYTTGNAGQNNHGLDFGWTAPAAGAVAITNKAPVLAYDFGDDPDGYSTIYTNTGPAHVIVPGLHLGASEDNEVDGQPSTGANGDGTDEDGVSFPTLQAGSSAVLTVTATNTGSTSAVIYGWIDFNGNGQFEASERLTTTVPAGTTNGVFVLTYSVPANAATNTYARFRLSTDAAAAQPTGVAADGEVEDYPVTINATAPAQFGDRVWLESDTDGKANTGIITPVAGIVITATDGTTVYTKTTTSQGYYSFTVPAGTYTVTYGSIPASYGNATPSSTPGGNSESGNAGSYAQTGNPDQSHVNNTTVTVAAGQANWHVDFAFTPVLVKLGNRLWIESDTDGNATTGTITPIVGQLVTATSSSGVIYTTTTNANGLYTITVPANAVYTVTTGTPAGTVPSTVIATVANDGNAAANNNKNHINTGTPVTVTTQDNLSVDFGFHVPPAQFGDRVWLESDTDGKANTGTLTPVAGIVMTATDGTTVYTTTTNSQGYYSFTVPAGTYTVTYGNVPAAYGVVAPSSTPGGNSESGNAGVYAETGNPDQSHVNNTTVTVAANEANWHVDFGFHYPPVKIGNRLWIENDTDGNANTGTVTPVVGQVVTATSSSGTVYTTTTDANGLYTITVPANAVYTVTTGTPAGTVPSTVIATVANDGNAAANNNKNHINTGTPVTVTTQDNLSVDFGFHVPLAQFGDRVWLESDTDGKANTGTLTPVAGMVITTTNGTNTYTKTTTSQGYYSFTIPAGTYTVTYGSVPASYGTVTPSATPGGNSESGNAGVYAEPGKPDQSHGNGTTVTVAAGEANWHIDFAFHNLVQVGNRLWIESDTDGNATTGSVTPVIGQMVTATSSTGVVYTTTTNVNGLYTITVPANDVYTVTTSTPAGTVPSTVIATVANDGNAAANDNKNHINTGTPVTVTTQDNLSVDFGFHAPLAQFGDRVWIEADSNGSLTTTETIMPVTGLVIAAMASTGQIYTATTNGLGYYSFTVPANLTYTVHYGPVPAIYGNVIPSATPGGNAESGNAGSYQESGNPDLNHAQDTTVFLRANEANWHVDFAFWPPHPQIALKKFTNGYDADTLTGPYLQAGSVVTWTYNLTNTGNVTLTNITLVDNVEGTITCTPTTLAPGAGTSCTQTGIASAGQYTNTAVVTGTPTLGPMTPVTSTNPSHYYGTQPGFVLKKLTNGYDADQVTDAQPVLQLGAPVTWTYMITNTGNVTLSFATGSLNDDKEGPINGSSFTLQPGATTTLTKQGFATTLGQYTNTATLPGTPMYPPVTPPDLPNFPPVIPPTTPITHTNPSHYQTTPAPAIVVKKYTNGYDADIITGPSLKVGAAVTWTYVITNIGNVTLTNVTLTDDKTGGITCPVSSLVPGATTTCTKTGTATVGQYINTASVVGTNVLSPTQQVTSTNPSHYFGAQPRVVLKKYTNGADADSIPGPQVVVGSVVTWTYIVTNTGNVSLINLTLTDDKVGGITCPVTALTPGATTTCTKNGIAQLGQYTNTAVVTGTPQLPPVTPPDLPGFPPATPPTTPVNDINPSHYYAVGLSLGNRLWVDNGAGIAVNRNNGVYDNGELAVPQGVVVELLNITGTVLLTTTTDSSGYYRFDNLAAGQYQVRIPTSEFMTGGKLYGYASSTGQDTNFAALDNNHDHGDDTVADGVISRIITLSATNPTGEVDSGATGAGAYGPNGDVYDNLTADFGFVPMATFGNFVWIESDTDGKASTGTITPVASQVMTATDSNGQVYTTTTNALGYYSFTVPTGIYTVTYGVPPAGTVPSATPNSNTADQNNPGTDQQSRPDHTVVTLVPGDNIPTIDFGFYVPLAQFGDRVWIESDTDGKANTGALTPVVGMMVTATDGTNTYTTTTNALGYYSFTVPASTYTVTYGSVPASYGNVVPSSTPGGNSESGNAGVYAEAGNPDRSHVNGTTVTVGDGQANWHVDFAFHRPVRLGNRLWIESDTDGDATTGAVTPVVSQVVTATSSTGVVYTTTTDANGLYTITVPANDTYTVTTSTPVGTNVSVYTGKPGNDQSHNPTGTVVTVSTNDDLTIDFGFHTPLAQFGDRVWLESDRDGLATTGVITPVAGMTITATSSNGLKYTTTTNSNGYYSFTLAAGTYTTTYGSVPTSYGLVTPSATPGGSSEAGSAGNYQQSGNPDQSHVNNTTVTVAAGQANWHVDFAFYQLVKLGNRLWIESDKDGDATTGTVTPVVSQVVTATSSTGVIYTTTTDNTGLYTITVPANDTYTVTTGTPVGTVPSIYNGTPSNDQSHNSLGTVVTIGTIDNLTIDFGFHIPLAQFGDRVWLESDTDGKVNTGTIVPVSGQTISATNGTKTYTTQTNANGYYSFTVLAGTYTVTYGSVPVSYGSVTPSSTPGGNNESGNAGSYQEAGKPDLNHVNGTTVTVGDSQANWHVDFAFTPVLVKIGNRLWIESDTDGDATTGSVTPVVNQVVTVTSSSGVVYTTTTDANGLYTITVPANDTYTVTTSIPSGTTPSVYNGTPSNDQSHTPAGTSVTVGTTDNLTLDFGFHTLLAQFGDRVWVESDNDGLASTGVITPVAGMLITATNGTNTYTTTTDANGYYSFTTPANTYTVTYGSVPVSYGRVTPSSTPGGNNESGNAGIYQQSGNLDQSHVNHTTVTVASGEANWHVDFAMHNVVQIGNRLWIENDTDGDATTGTIVPVVGQVVTVTSSSGVVYTTTTNANGLYTITVPANDTYTVTTSTPAGTTPSVYNGTPGNDQSHTPTGTPVTVGTTDNLTLDFGFHAPFAQFGDRVWLESDTDGLANTGTITPVAAMAINAISSNGTVYTTTTNANGYYSFTVPASTYTVTYSSVPASYGNVTPSSTPGGNNESGNAGSYQESGKPDLSHGNGTTVTVGDSQANWHVDFAFTPVLVKLGNRLWIEDDTDGDATTGTVTPVVNQVVTVTSSSGVVYTTMTDANGLYTITVPANNTYTVTTGMPAGTTPSVFNGTPGNDQSHTPSGTVVTVGTTNDYTIDFGFHALPTQFGDRIWLESDTDGLASTGIITPVTGMTITATNGTNTYTTQTNVNGYYSFTVPAGTYTVAYGSVPSSYGTVVASSTPGGNNESGNAGSYAQTGNPDQSHSNRTTVTVGAGEANWHVDFAFHNLVQIGNRLWIESDTDGDATTGTVTPVVGQVVTATSGSGVVYTTTTDANGLYTITVPANDTYTVTTGMPAGTTPSVFNGTPGNDQSHMPTGTVVTIGTTDNLSVDFGFHTPLAQFGDRVWVESDNDGLASTGVITPVAGMLIVATDSNGLKYAMLTNSNGYYSFTLAAGTYTVTYGSVPASYGVVTASATPGGNSETGNAGVYAESGNPDQSHSSSTTVSIAAGEANWRLDFAFYVPLASFGNHLWLETDSDGKANTGIITPVVGKVITATDQNSNVYTTTTDVNGYYTFTVPADVYTVTYGQPPAGTVPSNTPNGNTADKNNPGTDEESRPNNTVVTLVPGDNIPTIDFAFHVPPVQIGNRLWIEDDSDGDAATGTVTPVVGQVVMATDSRGVVYTTTTDANGLYTITVPANNTYMVTTGTPAGTTPSVFNGTPGDNQSHTPFGTVVTVGTTDNPTIDFGFYVLPATFGNFVWIETDTDGNASTGTITPVAGKTITATSGTGQVYTTVTNGLGYYSFTVPAGIYTVNYGTPPAGTVPSATPNGNTADQNNQGTDQQSRPNNTVVTLAPGDNIPTIDFGFYQPVSVGDYVWIDANRDGNQDNTEQPLPGVTVTLFKVDGVTPATDVNGNPVPMHLTGSDGKYLFTNLSPNDYVIRVTPPAGYVLTKGGASPNDNNNNDSNGVMVGNTIQSLPVTLTAGAEPIDDGDTNPDSNLTVDFGFYQPVTVGDRVWYDNNGNGQQDKPADEPGVPSVTVILYDATTKQPVLVNGKPLTTQTDGNGNYLFVNLPPGNYAVVFDLTTLPAGYGATTQDAPGVTEQDNSDANPTTGQTRETGFLASGQQDLNLDLGIVAKVNLGNLVWLDANNNGVVDTGEPGIPGVLVQLFQAGAEPTTATPLATTTTDAAGHYNFMNLLPGSYFVYIPTPPVQYPKSSTLTDANDDGKDNDDNGSQPMLGAPVRSPVITLTLGAEPANDGDGANGDLTVDFGFYALARLGDFVWFDKNKNGSQEGTETGVPGVPVTLYNSAGVKLATTATDASGYYSFDQLEPGDYFVEFTPPAAYQVSPLNQGGDDTFDSDADQSTNFRTPVTHLAANQHDLTLDLGLYLPTLPAAIGDRVWLDTNKDGVQDATETGIPGVIVTLYKADSTLVATTTTTVNGNYLFANLPPGDYFIQFTPPTAYKPSPQDQAGNDATDSDADLVTGRTISTTLDAGETDLTWDAGFYLETLPASIGDYVWADANINGIQDATETGIPGIKVNLYDGMGHLLATTQTDANGKYEFPNLAPGDYSLQFIAPSNYAGSPQNQGVDDVIDSDNDLFTGRTIVTTLEPGEHDMSWDAGFYLVGADRQGDGTQPAALGDRVWLDKNKNGVQDGDEQPGVSGVIVKLYTADGGLRATTTTDANGNYHFQNLAPGSYYAIFILPLDYSLSPIHVGDVTNDSDLDVNTGRTPLVTLGSGERNPTLDLGIFQSPAGLDEESEPQAPVRNRIFLPIISR